MALANTWTIDMISNFSGYTTNGQERKAFVTKGNPIGSPPFVQVPTKQIEKEQQYLQEPITICVSPIEYPDYSDKQIPSFTSELFFLPISQGGKPNHNLPTSKVIHHSSGHDSAQAPPTERAPDPYDRKSIKRLSLGESEEMDDELDFGSFQYPSEQSSSRRSTVVSASPMSVSTRSFRSDSSQATSIRAQSISMGESQPSARVSESYIPNIRRPLPNTDRGYDVPTTALLQNSRALPPQAIVNTILEPVGSKRRRSQSQYRNARMTGPRLSDISLYSDSTSSSRASSIGSAIVPSYIPNPRPIARQSAGFTRPPMSVVAQSKGMDPDVYVNATTKLGKRKRIGHLEDETQRPLQIIKKNQGTKRKGSGIDINPKGQKGFVADLEVVVGNPQQQAYLGYPTLGRGIRRNTPPAITSSRLDGNRRATPLGLVPETPAEISARISASSRTFHRTADQLMQTLRRPSRNDSNYFDDIQ